uniref:Uncharacterized protein n=1 Tax=uncultured marine microorganism HF4000_APKG7H23 TaxID=455551 RepID=B3T9U1_9ZZZZ|nr:hypothetical protein ALOHA_HF4000APKG7H23ctg3g15 [uncultured marine microorganism HF4000_APKG7H23]
MLGRQGLHGFLGPLHHADTVGQHFRDAQLVYFGRVFQTVQVYVVEPHTALVLVHQHEGGAMGVLMHSQPPRDALGEGGLSTAKLAAEEHQVSLLGLGAQPASQLLGLLRAARGQFQLPHEGFAPKALECIRNLLTLSAVSTIPLSPFLARKGVKKRETGKTPVLSRQRGKAPLHSLKAPKMTGLKTFGAKPFMSASAPNPTMRRRAPGHRYRSRSRGQAHRLSPHR